MSANTIIYLMAGTLKFGIELERLTKSNIGIELEPKTS